MKFLPLVAILAWSVFNNNAVGNDTVLPDATKTPGEVATNGFSIEQICAHGFAATVRNVPESEKKAVFIRYFGKVPANPGQYEIDHLISCELNGSQSVSNLWPQPYNSPVWNAHTKDRLENFLAADIRKELAAHGSDAAKAKLSHYQSEISKNWTNCYVTHLGWPKVLTINPPHVE